jgi:DNA polymerase III epsilon subunit-like protein
MALSLVATRFVGLRMILVNFIGKQEESVNGSLEDGDYKQPLVWIDLEMTGLNVEVDRILEIACIITNGDLTQSVEVYSSLPCLLLQYRFLLYFTFCQLEFPLNKCLNSFAIKKSGSFIVDKL